MGDLIDAARTGNIDRLYELIDADPNILERIDEIPFQHTPLHIAAEAGHTHFAIEVMHLKPSFSRKLNQAGFSPLDLALRNNRTETVRRLVKIDSELLRVKGKELWTPLHHVARMGDVNLLAEFLISCPPCIKDLTNRNESAVHIAAANGNIRALRVLVGWLDRTDNNQILHYRDDKGNTLMHIVASNYQHYSNNLLDVLRILNKKIANGERNADGLIAYDIILEYPYSNHQKNTARRILRDRSTYLRIERFEEFLSSPQRIVEHLLRYDLNMTMGVPVELVNPILVVAALIVTATYQAVLHPPIVDNFKGNISNITSSKATDHHACRSFKYVIYVQHSNFCFLGWNNYLS